MSADAEKPQKNPMPIIIDTNSTQAKNKVTWTTCEKPTAKTKFNSKILNALMNKLKLPSPTPSAQHCTGEDSQGNGKTGKWEV
jgi:hypothetical protein